MAEGIQIFDAAGNLKLDLTKRITTVLGFADTGFSDGYIEDDNLANGTPFWSVYSLGSSFSTSQPIITIDNSSGHWRLYWAFPASPGYQSRIVYGVY